MRRGGIFALITYILYTLLFGGLSLVFIDVLKSFASEELGVAGSIGVIFLLVYFVCGTLAICGLVAVVLKLLHMATGWIIFGIPCILIDVYAVFSASASIKEIAFSGEPYTGEAFIMLIPIIFSVGALISNIRSLRN